MLKKPTPILTSNLTEEGFFIPASFALLTTTPLCITLEKSVRINPG
jgi:hypothetical protein